MGRQKRPLVHPQDHFQIKLRYVLLTDEQCGQNLWTIDCSTKPCMKSSRDSVGGGGGGHALSCLTPTDEESDMCCWL